MTRPPAPPPGGRLFVYNGGFLDGRIRRILRLAGWRVAIGRPGAPGHPETRSERDRPGERPDPARTTQDRIPGARDDAPDGDAIGVWGRSPTAWRGERMAARTGAPLIRVEDAFLRSLFPGRQGEPPAGLLIDRRGVHFDASAPSDLEVLLATHPLDDPALLARARAARSRLARAHLTKYSAVDPALAAPDPGYVLVIDQSRGDASIRYGGADAGTFARMLRAARRDHPDAPIVIKTHPETAAGHRQGHFGPADADARTTLLDAPHAPGPLLAGATAVYAVTSQMGAEAIMAGHRPRLFGRPFYAGWGLSDDPAPLPRRGRPLDRDQLFAGAMILYPTWYDPFHDRLCAIEDVIDALEARTRAWRDDRRGYVASGMRLWKRAPLRRFYGGHGAVRFADDPARATALARDTDRPLLVWAGRETAAHAAPAIRRVEDGILRSRGLGAQLVPPLSLVADDLGIYYDPSRPSRLETLIAASIDLPAADLDRARRLADRIAALGLTKYNTGGPVPPLPDGHRILVPGQVEDDASIRLGAGAHRTNAALLAAVRDAHPEAILIYKPHPDVEAGLRPGATPAEAADVILHDVDAAQALAAVDAVWTLTSATGFEALIRGVPVTCLGAPFYAGWGLTRDLGPVPSRRMARPSLAGLIHAVLIGYPRYRDPVTGAPCPPEIIVDRLAAGRAFPRGPAIGLLAKAQGLLAGWPGLWR